MGRTRRVLSLALAGLLSIGLVACEGEVGGPPKDDSIKADDISYSCELGVEDGMSHVMFEYENNSAYEIVSVDLDMEMREDAKSEEIEEAFDYLIESGATEQDIRDSVLSCTSGTLVAPGETSEENAANIGMYYVLHEEQVELYEPSMLKVCYLYEDELYTEYYDYSNDTYDLDDEVVDVHQWSNSELASLLPEPEFMVIGTRDLETQFSFNGICVTPEQWEDYVSACQESGFTNVTTSTEDVFYAATADGAYEIDLFYDGSAGDGGVNGYVSPAA